MVVVAVALVAGGSTLVLAIAAVLWKVAGALAVPRPQDTLGGGLGRIGEAAGAVAVAGAVAGAVEGPAEFFWGPCMAGALLLGPEVSDTQASAAQTHRVVHRAAARGCWLGCEGSWPSW